MAKCNLDCLHCSKADCDVEQSDLNAIYCANWYQSHGDKKRAYQREYARRKRAEKKALAEKGVIAS